MLSNQRATPTTTIRNNNQEEDDQESPMMRDIHALEQRRRSSPLSRVSSSSTEFTTISHEFNALVLAGSRIRTENQSGHNNLGRIGENQSLNEENNPLSVVKKEKVESMINAWENAKIAKINNRFKREEVMIQCWKEEQVHKASSRMKEVERKVEMTRAKAMEKMQNEIAKAHRKAVERKASAEAKRGIKVANVVEIAYFMKATGRAPVKRSFF